MLFHFSEDPNIKKFEPRKSSAFPDLPSVVWSIDKNNAPLYFFPRDCPRIGYWPKLDSNTVDVQNFQKSTNAEKVITIESRWLQTIRGTKLYAYHFSSESFTCFDEEVGYYISTETIIPQQVEPVGDLIEHLVEAKVELRITPSLFPLKNSLLSSTLHVSMIRMRNAK
ncbi:hypothetical protein ERL59_02700 [Chengkuizengella sp. YPA3-1-1]|uniref:Uncharacterized protein n=1 Tax=Chengkuizengella marina TaxID=2507566 RepID=A0A6N9Q156_9BACL|nr:hypothetical protein [Chengkuizengella marina]